MTSSWLPIVLGVITAGTPGDAPTTTRPNIVFFMADDHATHAVGAYGGRYAGLDPTPHIDRLAAAGMTFRAAFCTNAICTPSRASVFTGTYSHVNGVYKFTPLDLSQPTLPVLLQKAGYHTSIVGKYHLYNNPRGFDDWSLLPGWGRYHDPEFIEMDGVSTTGILEDGRRTTYPGYCDDVIADKALAYLKEKRPGDRPFALFCHFKAPHDDWRHAERHRDLYETTTIPEPENLFDDGLSANRSGALTTTTQRIGSATPGHTLFAAETGHLQGHDRIRAQYQIYLRKYLRCVRGIDENVGRELEALRTLGLERNTVVFYTSDQGMFLGEHGLYDKRFMYEEALRFPLIVRWPGVVAPGSSNDDLVLNLDLTSTLLEIAGVSPQGNMQGRSLKPLLEGTHPADWRTSFYYRYYLSHFQTEPHHGVRTRTHKLIEFDRLGKSEVYDLVHDPAEMTNLIDDPASASTVAALKAELTRLQTTLKDDPADVGDHPRDGRKPRR